MCLVNQTVITGVRPHNRAYCDIVKTSGTFWSFPAVCHSVKQHTHTMMFFCMSEMPLDQCKLSTIRTHFPSSTQKLSLSHLTHQTETLLWMRERETERTQQRIKREEREILRLWIIGDHIKGLLCVIKSSLRGCQAKRHWRSGRVNANNSS